MAHHRLFARAVVAGVATLAASAALATAAGAPVSGPVWLERSALSGSSQDVRDPLVATSTDGSTLVVWSQIDLGVDRLRYTLKRRADAGWSAPQWMTGEGDDVSEYELVAGGDDTFVVAWRSASMTAYARSVIGDTLTDPFSISDADEAATGLALTPTASGAALLYTATVSNDAKVKLFATESGDGTWLWKGERWFGEPADPHEPAADVNAAGDGVVAWRVNEGGDKVVQAARFTLASGEFGDPADLAQGQDIAQARAAIGSDGAAFVSWIDGSTALDQNGQPTGFNSFEVSRLGPADTVWGTPEVLGDNTGMQLTPGIAAGADGDVVAVYQRYIDQGGYFLPAPLARTFDGSWGAPLTLSGAMFGGGPAASANAAGDVAVSYVISLGDGSVLNIGLAVRDGSTGDWDMRGMTASLNVIPQDGLPQPALGPDGDAVVVYPHGEDGRTLQNQGSGYVGTSIVVSDVAAPETGSVSVPESAETGDTVEVSANPFDLWATPVSVEWDFGDASPPVTGSTAEHSYSAVGDYTVTATAIDLAGHQTAVTREIEVSGQPATTTTTTTATTTTTTTPPAPPADDDEDTVVDDAKPPVITPPLIEVKLAGKTLTYNVKLTVKKGKSCSGKVQASFTYGNKRYRSNLKLKKVGTICRATGKTTLKKTPSTRTKIKIKISGKQVKSRALSSKRG